ncbi:MAG: TolB family protein [Methanosarcina sp.]
MTSKRKLFSTALASAFLVFVFLILISAAVPEAQVTKIGTGYDPAVYGNRVAWTDGVVIHVYDLTNNTNTTISSSGASSPDIYNDTLVWHDESSGTPRLTVYDIPTATRTYITEDVDQFSEPAIYGNTMVWSANESVYLRNLSTAEQTLIANGSNPDIYDTKVVYYSYSEDPEADITIRMYDLNTTEKTTVNSSGDPNTPHIWGNRVIWADLYNQRGYIAMYDISTNETIDVTQPLDTDPNGTEYGASTGTHIAIQNDKIVYNKAVNDYEGEPGVYVYNISTGQSTLIYSYPEEVYTTPEVYNNTVVWGIDENYVDNMTGNDIYLYELAS